MSEHTVPAPYRHPAGSFQFRLRHLFGLTTLSAIAAAIAACFGPGTLFTSGGIILAWMNWCGGFRIVQSGRRQLLTLGLAWITFLVSLALPSLRIFSTVYGWGAAWLAWTLPAEAISKGEIHVLPLLWFGSMDLANLFAISLPFLVWRLSVSRGQYLSAVFVLCMIGPWVTGADLNMQIGYHVWVSSFYVALTALPVRSWTLASMVCAALVSLGVAMIGGIAL